MNEDQAHAHIMLSKVKTLKGYKLDSLDGEIGRIKDFYFDDQYWTIRYLVTQTGSWRSGKQVLISPYALRAVNKEEKNISINLTKKQIENAPSWDSNKPVSRQIENGYYEYYGWPAYWRGQNQWGPYPTIERDPTKWSQSAQPKSEWDPNLRSTNEVSGYHIQATDGDIGHIEDFIVDDDTWTVRYLVINTGNWWPGKEVLVSPKWIERVSWSELNVFVSLTREAVKQSPGYTEESLLTRDYEIGLYQHYDRPGYWGV
jgi:uncharacterized protein YrrD